MKKYIFDIETDGIHATKIHCLSYYDLETDQVGSFTEYSDIAAFVTQEDIMLIAHNGVRYDIPTLKRILGIDIKAVVIDTLPLSWTLYPNNKKHGLEVWGEYFGIKKPEIADWENLSLETYVHRCEEDCKINARLWKKQLNYLIFLYDDCWENILKYCQYLAFKMDCIREQEEIGLKLDVEKCEKYLQELTADKEQKTKDLLDSMPKKAIEKKVVYKDAVQDKNGNVFQKGDLFFNSVIEEAPKEIVATKITGYKEANPNSQDQIKEWLYSLGWKPENIKHLRDKKTNEVKKIPQIASVKGQGEVCDSVKKLFEIEPKLKVLDGLSLLSHRISIFKGFLRDQQGGRLYPTCAGLTNTLRFQHAIVVNLPGFTKKYGDKVRSCLVADEGKELCGSDLSGIEDNTKRHYIYKYDPEYVKEMNTPGYDPHLELAVIAGYLTKEQADNHKKGLEDHKLVRAKAKVSNFALTYKCGIPTLARQASVKESEAKKLYDAYWTRNKAILDIEKSLHIKQFGDQKWLLNPMSGFWYTLRTDKDKFSTLNQGSAVFVFDTWLKYIRAQGFKVGYQCHDEWLGNSDTREITDEIIEKALQQVNEELKLNIEVKCSAAYGPDYYQCH